MLFAAEPSKARVEAFIKDGKSAAEKRFVKEYHQAFVNAPLESQIKQFVRDWRDDRLKRVPTEEVRRTSIRRHPTEVHAPL